MRSFREFIIGSNPDTWSISRIYTSICKGIERESKPPFQNGRAKALFEESVSLELPGVKEVSIDS
jgi:hypothetical protein